MVHICLFHDGIRDLTAKDVSSFTLPIINNDLITLPLISIKRTGCYQPNVPRRDGVRCNLIYPVQTKITMKPLLQNNAPDMYSALNPDTK